MSNKQQQRSLSAVVQSAAGSDPRVSQLAAELFVARTSTPGQLAGYSAAGIAAGCVRDAREFWKAFDSTPSEE